MVIVHGRGGHGGQNWSGSGWPTMQQSCAQAFSRPSCLTPLWCSAYGSSCKMLWRATQRPKVSQHSTLNLAVPASQDGKTSAQKHEWWGSELTRLHQHKHLLLRHLHCFVCIDIGAPCCSHLLSSSFVTCILLEKKEKFTLFSDHDGSLLKRQPGACIFLLAAAANLPACLIFCRVALAGVACAHRNHDTMAMNL